MKALPFIVDVQYKASVRAVVEAGVKNFGGIDIFINDVSVICLRYGDETTLG